MRFISILLVLCVSPVIDRCFYFQPNKHGSFSFAFDRVHVSMNRMNGIFYLWSLSSFLYAYLNIFLRRLLIFRNQKFLCLYCSCVFMVLLWIYILFLHWIALYSFIMLYLPKARFHRCVFHCILIVSVLSVVIFIYIFFFLIIDHKK